MRKRIRKFGEKKMKMWSVEKEMKEMCYVCEFRGEIVRRICEMLICVFV